jgi:hypothetical protein
LRDLTRRSVLRLDIVALTAPAHVAETRMNTHVSPTYDGANVSQNFYLTRIGFL